MTIAEAQRLVTAGSIHHVAGRLPEAEALYQEVLTAFPAYPDALHYLGILHGQRGRNDLAIGLLQKAVALCPNNPVFQNNMGNVLAALGQMDAAMVAYTRAIALQPKYADAHSNMGNILRDRNQFTAAVASYRKAISLTPNHADAHLNLGVVLGDLGEHELALVQCRKAVELNPRSPDAHFNLAVALMRLGQFEQGWEHYEARWLCKEKLADRYAVKPAWDGRPLNGRTLVVHGEQGLGDVINFVRYVPRLTLAGGPVYLQVEPTLVRLLQGVPGAARVLASTDPLPPFDVRCGVGALPKFMGTRVDNIPADVPYLRADPAMIEAWRQKLSAYPGPRVGLVWAGRADHKNDKNRSIALAKLAPLAAANLTFHSLQKGPAAQALLTPPPGMRLVDHFNSLRDFADTAALMANLDLLITVDTSVAHLAGAMAKPVWMLLPFNPDYRWLLNRDDSPWYPTMRLFRQPKFADWDTPLSRMTEELTKWAKERQPNL